MQKTRQFNQNLSVQCITVYMHFINDTSDIQPRYTASNNNSLQMNQQQNHNDVCEDL